MALPDELWLVDFGQPYPAEPAHHRPAVVVGPIGVFGSTFPYVFVVPLTTAARGLSLHVAIDANRKTGLDTASYAQCELLRSVSARRLVHQIGTVDETVAAEVAHVIRSLLGY